MPNIRFSGLTNQSGLAFSPGPVFAFDDPDAAPFFTAMGWADYTDDPADFRIPIGDLDIDPCAIYADGPNKWKFVMPDRAAPVRGITLAEAEAFVWDGQEVLISKEAANG